jgi:hypothetical protein
MRISEPIQGKAARIDGSRVSRAGRLPEAGQTVASSVFSHVTACTLAKPSNVTLYTRGFNHFVISMTAPIVAGRSDSYRVGLAPTEEGRLTTAHTQQSTSQEDGICGRSRAALWRSLIMDSLISY